MPLPLPTERGTPRLAVGCVAADGRQRPARREATVAGAWQASREPRKTEQATIAGAEAVVQQLRVVDLVVAAAPANARLAAIGVAGAAWVAATRHRRRRRATVTDRAPGRPLAPLRGSSSTSPGHVRRAGRRRPASSFLGHLQSPAGSTPFLLSHMPQPITMHPSPFLRYFRPLRDVSNV